MIFLWFFLAVMPMPPNLWDVVKMGCDCEKILEADKTVYRWHVKVWVQYTDGARWKKLYSIRDENERRKSLLDCDRWFSEVSKRQKKERR